MRECNGIASVQVSCNVLIKDLLLFSIGSEDHDDIRPRSCVCDRLHGQSGLLCLLR